MCLKMSLKISCLLVLGLALLVVAQENQAATDKVVICYYESWSSSNGTPPEVFDANLCTHVIYAFIDVNSNGTLQASDEDLDINQGLYKRVTDMKKRNSNLKVLLSAGGGNPIATVAFKWLAQFSSNRAAFVKSAEYYLSTYNFDGLDVDWEFPGDDDKANYINLLQELKDSFSSKGWLLTAAVGAIPDAYGYDAVKMSNILDFFNVMSYDMYGFFTFYRGFYTGQNSPLFASSVENTWQKKHLNLAASARNWINAGASPNKMAMGVAFYGRSYTLISKYIHGVHAPIIGVGPGQFGLINYYNICSTYENFTRVWDNEQKNPYKYSDRTWIGYDDKDSIWTKADYIKQNNYAGVMIWPIDGDDVHGICGESQLLLKQVNNGLGRTSANLEEN